MHAPSVRVLAVFLSVSNAKGRGGGVGGSGRPPPGPPHGLCVHIHLRADRECEPEVIGPDKNICSLDKYSNEARAASQADAADGPPGGPQVALATWAQTGGGASLPQNRGACLGRLCPLADVCEGSITRKSCDLKERNKLVPLALALIRRLAPPVT